MGVVVDGQGSTSSVLLLCSVEVVGDRGGVDRDRALWVLYFRLRIRDLTLEATERWVTILSREN